MKRNVGIFFLLLFVVVALARLCHTEILWAEETLPLAAARQMLNGKVLYRGIWFDKPPLLPALYLLWGAQAGWLLRLAGAVYVLLASALAYRFASDLWSRTEGLWAAGLLAFFLTFDIPSSVLPLAADLLMLAPHLAAVYLAWRGRTFWSGVLAGIAFLINPKGLFVLAACALWGYRSLPMLALGFATPTALAAAWLGLQGALLPYFEEVWRWGSLYAEVTFLQHPVRDGIVRTLDWMGFHAALIIAAAVWFLREPEPSPGRKWRWLAWAAISYAAVAAGWRFFPRYFFQLLPVTVLAASRGFTLLGRKRVAVLALLLVPLIRFGPRYVMLAVRGPDHWSDAAMDQDSRHAARFVRSLSRPGDTLFVWGFRPELYVYTGLPAASMFLDSQPLTGVPADRHLTQSQPVAPQFTSPNRAELTRSKPTFILDGLGLYNPHLAIGGYADLRDWLSHYKLAARSADTLIYERIGSP